MKRAGSLLLVLALMSCASATLTAFRDPAFQNRRFAKIAVFAVGMYLENASAVESQVCQKIAPAPCISGKALLPPTRSYASAEADSDLAKAGVDGVLFVVLGDDQSVSRYLGTIASATASSSGNQSGSTNLYGNTGVWSATSDGTASAQAVAAPVYGYSRTARAAVAMFDRASGKIA